MAKFTPPTKPIKPQDIEIGQTIEVHAQSLATFKTYVSRYNKDRPMAIRFEYGDFVGNFCPAKRGEDVVNKNYKPELLGSTITD